MDTDRRRFLKLSCAGLAGLATVATLPGQGAATPRATTPSPEPTTYPELKVANLNKLPKGAVVSFTYPDPGSPAILLRMGQPVLEGVGPGQDVVAYSTLCTHKGCPVAWRPQRQLLICPCHWSVFDPAKGGTMVIGQASQHLPQIRLRVDPASGDIFAVGVSGLIYGRHTNIVQAG